MSTQSVEDRSASSRASSSSAGSGIASIIEGRDNIKDFAALQIEEIDLNVQARRNRIFLLLEEVRRLRVQRRLKSLQGPPPETSSTAANEVNETLKLQAAAESEMVTGAPTTMPFDSALPFLPQLTESKLTDYYLFYVGAVSAVILFGGLVAPILELKLGIGNTSYLDFIRGAHLPAQLAEVDPIVASFSGGAVGVLTTLLIIEVNNAKEQVKKRCVYCEGKGYLACASCGATGKAEDETSCDPSSPTGECRCPYCSGAGKVMCPSCLCTGMTVSTEHDPRIDPFV